MPSRIKRGDVGDVDLGALAQHVDELLVDVLDLEQREERRVDGHEANASLGALADARERLGARVHGLALRPAQAQPDLVGQLAEQLLLVLEVPVEEALGDAGLADDVDDPGVGVAPLGEQARPRSRGAAACAPGPAR